MEQIVLDTSVVAKLFLKEEGSDMAVRMKDSHIQGRIEIVLPSLARYELINALKYKKFGKEEIREALEVIKDYGFMVVELNDAVINKIGDFSVELDISAYDATYISLSQRMGIDFYTADRKLILKAKGLKFVKHFSTFL